MQIIDIRLNDVQEALLALACGADQQPQRTIEEFARWLCEPLSNEFPAIQHGARLGLAEDFRSALSVREGDTPAGARVWFVTRHPGALAWMYAQGIRPYHLAPPNHHKQ